MRILLLYPAYRHHDGLDARSPSLSLLYLAARLEADGHKVTILDASLGPVTPDGQGFRYGPDAHEALAGLDGQTFDLVGVTCSFASRWPFVAELIRAARRRFPHAPLVTGGLFPTYAWSFCLEQCPELDAVFLGEAEESLAAFASALACGQTVAQACQTLAGAAWRDKGAPASNPRRGFIDNLDGLPFPAWHLLNLQAMFAAQRRFHNLRPPYFTVLTSRGCPGACTFCNMYITHGRAWRPRSAENVVDELAWLVKRYGVRRFFIADDNFSHDLSRAKAICRLILHRGLAIEYICGNGLAVKRLDRELLELLKRSGCQSVALAIESGSERIRNKVYKKGLATDTIERVAAWCAEIGLPTVGFFMVGAPGETQESIEETKALIRRLPLNLITCGILTPYPGTAIHDLCVQKGYLREVSPQEAARLEFSTGMLATETFTPEQAAAWQREIYMCFIASHWPGLVRELLHPRGLISFRHFAVLEKLTGLFSRKPAASGPKERP